MSILPSEPDIYFNQWIQNGELEVTICKTKEEEAIVNADVAFETLLIYYPYSSPLKLKELKYKGVLAKHIRNINCSEKEQATIMNIDFSEWHTSLSGLIQAAIEIKILRLKFEECVIPELDENFNIDFNRESSDRPLYMLSFVNWTFSEHKTADIIFICNSIKTDNDATQLSMLDLSDNDFFIGEVGWIWDSLRHIELICIEGNANDISDVDYPNLIF